MVLDTMMARRTVEDRETASASGWILRLDAI